MRRFVVATIGVVVAAGCGAQDAQDSASTASPVASSIHSYCPSDPGVTTSADDGWVNDWVWQQYGWGSQVQFAVTPQAPSQGPIDAVIGLAEGPAATFSDMGPIIRFNPSGRIDARDGGIYRAQADLPYSIGTQYLVHLYIDFDAHTYTATIGHYGDPNPVTIAQDYAFRTEQADMSRADTLAREIDSDAGSVTICGYAATANSHLTDAGDGWAATPFLAQSGVFTVDVEATAYTGPIDAVVGLAADTPSAFSDLAAIARFNPNGTFDARDGNTYRADTELTYDPVESYHFVFDVDVPAGTYSVTVVDRARGASTRIATDYAFRTEQQGVTSLSTLGQFVDGDSGRLDTSFLTETY